MSFTPRLTFRSPRQDRPCAVRSSVTGPGVQRTRLLTGFTADAVDGRLVVRCRVAWLGPAAQRLLGRGLPASMSTLMSGVVERQALRRASRRPGTVHAIGSTLATTQYAASS